MNIYDEVVRRFDEKYKEGHTPWSQNTVTEELEYFLSQLQHTCPDGRVLDIGCGDGWLSHILAQRGFTAHGLDSSKTAIENAIASKKSESEAFEVCDILSYNNLNESYDIVIDRGLLHHIPEEYWSKYLTVVGSCLKSEGLFYFVAFSDNSVKKGFDPKKEGKLWNKVKDSNGYWTYDHFFNEASIRQTFQEAFEIVEIKEESIRHGNGSQLIHAMMKKRKDK